MKFIRYIILLIALGVVVSCNRNEEPVERPLYPTEGAINARFSVNDSVTVVLPKAISSIKHQLILGVLHQISMTSLGYPTRI